VKRTNSKTVNLIGFPMDLGADRRGVDMGPSALRIAGLPKQLQNLGYTIIDDGDIIIQIKEKQKVERALSQNQFPLCIGGDHSMGIGTIAGISSYCRKNKLILGVIWIDAHADMNTNKTTPSGNIHGMPLAANLGLGHKKLVNFYGFSPKLKPENTVLIGVRSIDEFEKRSIKKLNLSVYTMSDIDKLGIHRIIARVLKQFQEKVDHIHVSFDLDSVDPTLAPGVGTPIPGGLSFRESHLLMESIAECGCMSSLEVTEVNPILDDKNKSAKFAAELIASSMGQRIF